MSIKLQAFFLCTLWSLTGCANGFLAPSHQANQDAALQQYQRDARIESTIEDIKLSLLGVQRALEQALEQKHMCSERQSPDAVTLDQLNLLLKQQRLDFFQALAPLSTSLEKMEEAYAVLKDRMEPPKCVPEKVVVKELPEVKVRDEALFKKGKQAFRDKKYAVVIDALSEYLKPLQGKHAKLREDALLLRAQTYFRVKQMHKALTDYDALIENFPKSKSMPEILYYTAEALKSLGQVEEAKGFVKELRARFPTSSFAKKNS